MTPSETPAGRIITFYSYKGGTGRSMALANIACLLAKSLGRTSQRVLVMDWDLEAPGLHRFFSAKSDLPGYEKRPGVINYFCSLRELLTASPEFYGQIAAPDGWRVLGEKLPLDDYVIPDVISGVDFMRAGRFDPDYPKLVGAFNWIELFERFGASVRAFRELLINSFGFTLVDSRTGLTDVSGICTTLLPERLVGVFTPNRQSLHGLCDLVAQAIEYRRKSDDFRPLSVFPLPSRVENAEKDLREQWRKDYQERFEDLFRRLHGTERCDLTDYFNEVLLPHVSYYAYGENIAVLQERSDAISLSAAYQRFFERLMRSDFAWEVPEPEKPVAAHEPAPAAAPAVQKYDAFLSYANADAKAVEQVDSQLRNQGIKTFFGLHDIAPGEEWTGATSAAMLASKAIVAFAGPGGSGPWQNQEVLATLENHAKDSSKRIIPVLLPKAPSSDQLKLPTFLRSVQWVDLRSGVRDRDAVGNLVWALTGQRPVRKLSRLMKWVVGVAGALLLLVGVWLAIRSLEYRGYIGDIAKYRKLVLQNPNDADAHSKLAAALTDWGRTDEAVSEYRKAVLLNPKDAEAMNSLVDLLARMGRWGEVATAYRALVQVNPNDVDARLNLVLALKNSGRTGEALAEFDRLNMSTASGFSGQQLLFNVWLWLKYDMSDLDRTIKAMRFNVASDPSNWQWHAFLAEGLEQKGDLQGALDEYRAANKIKPDDKNFAAAVERLSKKLSQAAATH